MCGIAGIWSDDLPRDAREIVVRQMLQCMGERGPDATRVIHEAGCTVGFNLLAIVGGRGERRDTSSPLWSCPPTSPVCRSLHRLTA
jgi:asparagine synthetase B (glutamine-hydrolysing)